MPKTKITKEESQALSDNSGLEEAPEPVSFGKKNVVHAKDAAGNDIYAWRKDGQRPVIDLAEFSINRHSALRPKQNTPDGLAADFADHVGPQ